MGERSDTLGPVFRRSGGLVRWGGGLGGYVSCVSSDSHGQDNTTYAGSRIAVRNGAMGEEIWGRLSTASCRVSFDSPPRCDLRNDSHTEMYLVKCKLGTNSK